LHRVGTCFQRATSLLVHFHVKWSRFTVDNASQMKKEADST
jgi:hypothetical protein